MRQFFRCECGVTSRWSRTDPPPCTQCSECGTNLSSSAIWVIGATPHHYVGVLSHTAWGLRCDEVCVWCDRTPAQISGFAP